MKKIKLNKEQWGYLKTNYFELIDSANSGLNHFAERKKKLANKLWKYIHEKYHETKSGNGTYIDDKRNTIIFTENEKEEYRITKMTNDEMLQQFERGEV